MIFLGIWTIELYLDNYSTLVPVTQMSTIANLLAMICALLSVVVLSCAKKSTTDIKITVIGGLLYLTVSVVLMALTQWQKPQTFYLQHERPVIEHEIQALQEELEYIDKLKGELGIDEKVPLSQQRGLKETGEKVPSPAR
jgi:hypothetical protein